MSERNTTHISDYNAALERELFQAEIVYNEALAAYEKAEKRLSHILTKMGADDD